MVGWVLIYHFIKFDFPINSSLLNKVIAGIFILILKKSVYILSLLFNKGLKYFKISSYIDFNIKSIFILNLLFIKGLKRLK